MARTQQQSGSRTGLVKTNYIPDYQQRAISGAKPGQKFGGRPFIMDVRHFPVSTKTGVVIGTYVLFGGVPPKTLHEKLTTAGFKVRRRPAWYVSKKDQKTYKVDGNDRECYAIYYNEHETPTEEQAKLLAGLTYKTLNAVAKQGQTFLLPTWDAVDRNWGDRNEWLQICTVDPEEDSPVTNADEDGDDFIDLDSIDDMI
jgi:hypothetical protein